MTTKALRAARKMLLQLQLRPELQLGLEQEQQDLRVQLLMAQPMQTRQAPTKASMRGRTGRRIQGPAFLTAYDAPYVATTRKRMARTMTRLALGKATPRANKKDGCRVVGVRQYSGLYCVGPASAITYLLHKLLISLPMVAPVVYKEMHPSGF